MSDNGKEQQISAQYDEARRAEFERSTRQALASQMGGPLNCSVEPLSAEAVKLLPFVEGLIATAPRDRGAAPEPKPAHAPQFIGKPNGSTK